MCQRREYCKISKVYVSNRRSVKYRTSSKRPNMQKWVVCLQRKSQFILLNDWTCFQMFAQEGKTTFAHTKIPLNFRYFYWYFFPWCSSLQIVFNDNLIQYKYRLEWARQLSIPDIRKSIINGIKIYKNRQTESVLNY